MYHSLESKDEQQPPPNDLTDVAVVQERACMSLRHSSGVPHVL
jgi:hypothetical protein